MKIRNILVGFLLTILAAGVLLGLVYGDMAIFTSINNEQKIQDTFPAGSPVVLKNLDIKGNVSGYAPGSTVNILVIDKLGQSHVINVEMSLLSKP